jgi:hypothetical protein
MAQAVIMYLCGNNGDRIPYKVGNASAIAKGDILELSDPMTVTAHNTNVDTPIVGVAAEEKVANDGQLWISVITNAVIKVQVAAAGTTTIGDTVSMANAAGRVNLASTLDDEKGWSIGYALENGAANEFVAVRMIK